MPQPTDARRVRTLRRPHIWRTFLKFFNKNADKPSSIRNQSNRKAKPLSHPLKIRLITFCWAALLTNVGCGKPAASALNDECLLLANKITDAYRVLADLPEFQDALGNHLKTAPVSLLGSKRDKVTIMGTTFNGVASIFVNNAQRKTSFFGNKRSLREFLAANNVSNSPVRLQDFQRTILMTTTYLRSGGKHSEATAQFKKYTQKEIVQAIHAAVVLETIGTNIRQMQTQALGLWGPKEPEIGGRGGGGRGSSGVFSQSNKTFEKLRATFKNLDDAYSEGVLSTLTVIAEQAAVDDGSSKSKKDSQNQTSPTSVPEETEDHVAPPAPHVWKEPAPSPRGMQ